ncbi:heavy metal-responsive transcriptional regulator [Micrococcus terreus]|uniref:heavy metal-responsive transcriptional regulator n=1 Tax=Micrococcus terreus TaxID=574650 RepID=UPI0033F2A157
MTTQTALRQGMRIGELAEAAGLSTDTIRYYEKAGLLPPTARTPGGYRAYGPEAVDRLHFIQGAQRLGLRLEDIGNLLTIRDTGTCPCEPAADFLTRRLAEVDAQIQRLEALRTEMVTMLEGLPAGDCPQPAHGTWLQQNGR